MIKRYTLLFLAINVTSLYAILGGVGINFLQDSFSLESEVIEDSPVGAINRSGMDSPVGVGFFTYLTIIPFIDLEANINLTAASYDYSYTD